MTNRRFTVASGRVLVLPRSIAAGPGATNMRFTEGATLELAPGQVDRFIRNRIALGDLVEQLPAARPPRLPAKET